jgi:hypothetical protein
VNALVLSAEYRESCAALSGSGFEESWMAKVIRLTVNASDMGGDQLLVVDGSGVLCLPYVVRVPYEMFADRAEDQLFDFGRRARD